MEIISSMGSVMSLFMKQKKIPRVVSKGINQFVHVRVMLFIFYINMHKVTKVDLIPICTYI